MSGPYHIRWGGGGGGGGVDLIVVLSDQHSRLLPH